MARDVLVGSVLIAGVLFFKVVGFLEQCKSPMGSPGSFEDNLARTPLSLYSIPAVCLAFRPFGYLQIAPRITSQNGFRWNRVPYSPAWWLPCCINVRI